MKLRKISTAYQELKLEDPNSEITLYSIRQMVVNSEISHIRRGRKILIDLDELKEYLATTARKMEYKPELVE